MKGRRVYEAKRIPEKRRSADGSSHLYAVGTACTGGSRIISDVPLWHWANPYVGKAAGMGIVNGYGGGKFGPSDNVTYEQAVAMLVRSGGFSDEAAKAGGYPDGFLKVAEEKGFLTGIQASKGEPLSRADIAMILYNGADLLITIE